MTTFLHIIGWAILGILAAFWLYVLFAAAIGFLKLLFEKEDNVILLIPALLISIILGFLVYSLLL